MNTNAVTIPTLDALQRDLREIDKAIVAARRRGDGGGWPLLRQARQRLQAVLDDAAAGGGGETSGVAWRRPEWATRTQHLFLKRTTATEAVRQALAELDGIERRGGVEAFSSVSVLLADAFGCDPVSLDWRPDVVLLEREKAAVEQMMRQLYGPADEPAPADEETQPLVPLAATA